MNRNNYKVSSEERTVGVEVDMAESIQRSFYGGLGMERDRECIVVNRGVSKHLIHAQTGMAVLDVDKLKRIAACDTVSVRARELAKRKLEILERDEFSCVECGEKECLTIDHTESISEKYNLSVYDSFTRSKICQLMRSTADGYPAEICNTICVWCHCVKNGWTEMQNDDVRTYNN